ncbi:MAG TPA: hypothetical protein VHA76_00115 [Solirubrobacterales bacterium]|nr:hypothetical protein [Solirubrobacterales bacterium]
MIYAEEIDGAILATLCEEPGPWPMEELRREHGGGITVDDAVARLARRGLVLRLDGGLVIASAAGRYAVAVGEAGP